MKVLNGLKNACKINFNTLLKQKIKFLRLKILSLRVSYKEKNGIFVCCILKVADKGVGSGTILQRYDPRIRTKMSRIPNTGRLNIQFKVQYLSAAIDPEADLLVHEFLELWGVRLGHSLLLAEICNMSNFYKQISAPSKIACRNNRNNAAAN
jgi:hypothetical protein